MKKLCSHCNKKYNADDDYESEFCDVTGHYPDWFTPSTICVECASEAVNCGVPGILLSECAECGKTIDWMEEKVAFNEWIYRNGLDLYLDYDQLGDDYCSDCAIEKCNKEQEQADMDYFNSLSDEEKERFYEED